jgi:hypothetical protein
MDMADHNESRGIFRGTDKIIFSFLGLGPNQCLKHESVSQSLGDPGKDFLALLSELCACIEANRVPWKSRPPSRENWRCKRNTELDDRNVSLEVLLERAVARLSTANWSNQVPVASGLIDHQLDKRAAIDLVELTDERARFVELKWQSDTPAFAAFEVLRYGLAYLFCRVNAAEFGYTDRPLMRVGRVDLQVIAPTTFYQKHDLGWLDQSLNRALGEFSFQKTSGQLAMGFEFLAMPPDFELPFRSGKHVKDACATEPLSETVGKVRNLFENLSPPVWSAVKASPA